MRLINDFHCKIFVFEFTIERKLILHPTLTYLVHPKPLTKSIETTRQKFWHIVNVLQKTNNRVIDRHTNNFSIHLAIVNHAQDAQHFYRMNLTQQKLSHANLHPINRIIVTLHPAMLKDHLCALSRLRECAIVSHHITVLVEAWNAVFDVLLDWIEWLTRCDFKLCTRSLGNLTHKVIPVRCHFFGLCAHRIAHKEWNIMPWTHLTHKPSL